MNTPALLALILASTAAEIEPRPSGLVGHSDPCTIIRVVDGDTVDVRIRGVKERLRLLDIDTEESYASPGKPITDFGLSTSSWAKGRMKSEEPCFVEYGDERRDVYDRLLAYLWVRQGRKWTMFNLDSVELGYSPYFSKYGYSRAHHDAFVAAEKKAQEAKLGIWDPANSGQLRGKYLGEGGLRPWWDARAESLKNFAEIRSSRTDLIETKSRFKEVKGKMGTEVTIFTAIRQAKEDSGRWIGKCEGALYEPLAIVPAYGSKGVEESLRRSVGYYRYFTGIPEMGDDGKTLYLMVDSVDHVSADPPPPPKKAARKGAIRDSDDKSATRPPAKRGATP